MKINLPYITILFLLVSLNHRNYAQTANTAPVLSGDLIRSGIQLHDEGKYAEAIAMFKQVSHCDPRYSDALYEMALSYCNSGDNEEALKKCEEALFLNREDAALYGLIGSILDNLGRQQEGIKLLHESLKKWPYNQNLLYNLAVIFLNTGQPLEAEEILLKSILINPYHVRSHLGLAQANYMMGRLAQSYLAYNMAIMINPEISLISEYEKVISGKSLLNSQPQNYPYPQGVDHQKWDELKWLLQSELAFSNDFEYDYNVSYTVTRQSLMLFRKMMYNPADPSLYNQLYVRLFSEIMQKEEFETYINYLLQNTNDNSVAAWSEKNKARIKDFISWAQQFINSGRSYGFSAQDETAGKKLYHFDDAGNLKSIGSLESKGDQEVKQGKWIIIGSDGYLSEQGTYKDDKTEGEWFVYWPGGQVKQHLLFSDGLLNGTSYTYFPNGTVENVYRMKNGKKNGVRELYTSSGFPVSSNAYTDDRLNGPGAYTDYEKGFKREYIYVNDTLNGKISEKWLNDVPKLEAFYSKNEYNGIYRTWYPNSKPESEAFYTLGIKTGRWVNYYDNGIKKEEGEYDENGKLTGKSIAYDRTGNIISEETEYKDGILNGTRTEYFPGGGKQNVHHYTNDTLVAIECFDNDGNLLYKTTRNDGLLNYKAFYPDGFLLREGLFQDKQRQGSWKSYDPAGQLTEDLTFGAAGQSGPQRTFHNNGRIKEEYVCDSNMIIGEYKEFYSCGLLKSKGYFDKMGRTGDWFNYYRNDSLESHGFYAGGKLAGKYIQYTPAGKKSQEIFYNDEEQAVRTIIYDQAGNISLDMQYEYGTFDFKELYSGGSVKSLIHIADRSLHGNQERLYSNGQPEQQYRYEHGILQGDLKSWDYNGNLNRKFTFLLGRAEGESCWYEDSCLTYKCNYEYGQYQGKAYDYYYNGRLYREMDYVDNNRNGNTDYYSPDGTFMYRIRFSNDVMKGYSYHDRNDNLIPEIPIDTTLTEIVCYYSNGKICIRIPLKKGLYHGKIISYYPSGSLLREAVFVDDDLEGTEKHYYPDGKLRESTVYLHDSRCGPYISYHNNGKKFREGNYVFGAEDGLWYVYDDGGKRTETLNYCNGELYEITKD